MKNYRAGFLCAVAAFILTVAAMSQNDSNYVRAVPECGRQELEDDTLFIVNVCNINVSVAYTSSGDVWGGMPIGPGQHHRTAWSGEAVRRVGGVDVYTCPGDSTPVDLNGNPIQAHYKGAYRCRR